MNPKIALVLLFVVALVVATPAFAGPVNFNFAQFGTGDLCHPAGSHCTVAFTAGGLELDVTAWLANNVQADPYFKNNGGDEVGLGIAGTTDNEINYSTQFLQFDLSKLKNVGALNLTVGFNSTTGGEKWGLSYSNTSGTLNKTYIATGTTENTVTVSTTSGTYLDISSLIAANTTGSGGNLLVASAATSPAPEPSSLLLLGSGLIGMGSMLRRKSK